MFLFDAFVVFLFEPGPMQGVLMVGHLRMCFLSQRRGSAIGKHECMDEPRGGGPCLAQLHQRVDGVGYASQPRARTRNPTCLSMA